jgi:curved DNA-binding protein CbpA
VFDEDLSAQPPQPAAAEPPRRVLGPQAPPRVEHMYTGPAPEGLDAALDGSDGEADVRARAHARSAAVERAVNAVRASEAPPVHDGDLPLPVIGPAAMPPPVDAGKRMLGPMVPPREVLEAAAEETAFAVGPPPPELVAEADVATPETRDQAVTRVLRLVADGQGNVDAYALLGVEEHATAGEVRKAFWRASLLTHPDKCDHPRAADAFAAITKAKDILADASQRRALDDKRQETRLRAEFAAELEGKIQAAKWRQSRGMAPLAEDAELLRLASGEAEEGDRREAWMTELPQERQARPGAQTVQRSVTAFRQDERAERDVSWAETPAQKLARERQMYIAGPQVGALTHGDGDSRGSRAAMPEVREKSLLEKHQEAQLKKRKTAGPAAATAPQPFDRDRDLSAPHKQVDLAKLQQQQGTLSSRFGGSTKGKHT